jgi:hypothetical protein
MCVLGWREVRGQGLRSPRLPLRPLRPRRRGASGRSGVPPSRHPRHAANRNVLEALWTNFNSVADGFGLNLAVFQTICSGVDGLVVTADQCQKLFAAFDSDQVGPRASTCAVRQCALGAHVCLVHLVVGRGWEWPAHACRGHPSCVFVR